MKQRLLFLFAFLVTMITGTWADVLPSPVYFNDFSSSSGLTVVGNGTFELSPDPRFGKVFHNDPSLTKAIRTNWLELPSDIFSHSAQTKEMTIGFWVNKMSAEGYFFCPLFTAYGNDNVNKSHAWTEGGENGWWPFFYLETRGLMQWNAGGYCDFTNAQNDAGTNAQTTAWTDDGKWHYVTMTFTTSKAVVYVDGEVLNSWTIADDGLAGLFTQTDLTHFCLGGNQAFGWDDPDPAFAFDNFAVYDKALSAAQIKQVMAAVQPDYSAPTTPLTFEAIAEGTLVVSNPKTGMQYSVNEGPKTTMDGTTEINVTAGDKVQFYGNGTSITKYGSNYGYDNTTIRGKSGAYNVYGNIMSLVDEENFATATTLTSYNAFNSLFRENKNLTDASGLLLPATTLATYCYSNMFYGCTALTAAPALPATTLVSGCYQSMFANCTSLTTAPKLPAMTLTDQCYQAMFSGCTSLTAGPALPATTLAEECYDGMFRGCTSLTTAPELPATTVANESYANMFSGCTGLTAAPVLPAINLGVYCYENMFQGCTSLTTIPEISATKLVRHCYKSMFSGCTSLTTAPKLPATTLDVECYESMFYGCTSLTTAPELPATTLAVECYGKMFKDCTSLTAAPELTAPILTDGCYSNMFSGCTNLSSVTCLAHDISAPNCTYKWLDGVAATGTFTAANADVAWQESNVSGAPAGWAKEYGPPIYTPLTIEAKTAGTIQVIKPQSYMKYKKNNGSKTSIFGTTTINVEAGDKVEFYGNGTLIQSYSGTKIAGGTAQCIVYGNIMSLVDEVHFPTATKVHYRAFSQLFENNTLLTDASGLVLPATTLAESCYEYMFNRCTGLTAAPALPATTLAESCYNQMFYGCSSLTVAPELPATTLADACYLWMFGGCSNLTVAPELPATTLAGSCYASMFYGCTGLTTAPVLPATTLATYCYTSMFSGCTGLTTAPELSATTLAERCYSAMFSGCTSLTAAPALPATTLADYCYDRMFSGCTGLTAAPALPATTLADGCYNQMFYGCTSLTVVPALTATTLANNCYLEMFSGCTGLTAAPNLPATNLNTYCYGEMFEGCTGLTAAPELLATTLAEGCYAGMFSGCTGLTATPALPATTLTDWCYSGMFRGCTSLTAAPELPATTLANFGLT